MESDSYELTPEDITEQETELEAPSDEETEYTEEDYGDDYGDDENSDDNPDEESDPDSDPDPEESDLEESDLEESDLEESDPEESDPDAVHVNNEIAALTAQGDAAEQLLAGHNINYTALCQEYAETGKLSEKSLASLNKAGFPKALIENYIEGQQSRLEASYGNYIKTAAGGEKQYTALCQWAANNLSEAEIRRYDNALDTHNLDTALTALEGLMLKYEKANGNAPEIIRGKAPARQAAIKGFNSMEEMADAMEDPRYEKDPAYTHKIEQRMLATEL